MLTLLAWDPCGRVKRPLPRIVSEKGETQLRASQTSTRHLKSERTEEEHYKSDDSFRN